MSCWQADKSDSDEIEEKLFNLERRINALEARMTAIEEEQ